jgi:hypothetical protein
MKCDRVKNLLLTDYHDGCLDRPQCVLIEKHLRHCQDCRDFYAVFLKTAVEPFRGSEESPLPDGLWDRIQSRIEAEGKSRPSAQIKRIFADMKEAAARAIVLPRPVFSLAMLAGLLFFFAFYLFPLRQTPQVSEYLSENVLYFAAIPEETAVNGENDEFGSIIELMFL